jgi:hypothetical protein
LCKYDSHMNIESTVSIQSVKYLYGYVLKAIRCVLSSVHNEVDEIKQYSDCRITSASEAIWRTLRLPAHGISPNVIRLSAHTSDDRVVTFNPNGLPNEAVEQAELQLAAVTPLTGWFAYNAANIDSLDLRFVDFPRQFTWNARKKAWQRRVRGLEKMPMSRLYCVSPTDRELFAVRALLLNVTGKRSFLDLRTVDDAVHETFTAAAIALGIFDSAAEYYEVLRDAAVHLSPNALRELLLLILEMGCLADPLDLCKQNVLQLTEDFDDGNNDHRLRLLLIWLSKHCFRIYDDLGLPTIEDFAPLCFSDSEMLHDQETLDSRLALLNLEQLSAFNTITGLLDTGGVSMLSAKAGTGKTFVIETVMQYARSQNHLMLCVASSALAASLIQGGTTAHAAFKIPIKLGAQIDSDCKHTLTHLYR